MQPGFPVIPRINALINFMGSPGIGDDLLPGTGININHAHINPCRTRGNHVQAKCGAIGHVNQAAVFEWPAIIDLDDNLAAVVQIGDFGISG